MPCLLVMVGFDLITPCFNGTETLDSDTDNLGDVGEKSDNEATLLMSIAESGKPSAGNRRRRVSVSAHPSRWYVLIFYCVAAFMQVVIWDTWGPISSSAFLAFPSWDSHSLALLNSWGSLMYLFSILPFCWFLSTKGLRTSILLASFLSLSGTAVRCFGTENETLFTVMAHLGAILNGMSGVILSPAPAMLSALWFPLEQRTSATGIGTAFNQLGMAGSYLLGPLVVSTPGNSSDETSAKLRQQISTLMILDFVIFATISILLFIYFPDRPPRPPSKTSIVERLNFKAAIKKLLWSQNMWLLCIAAGLCQGVTGPWMSMITIIFSSEGVTQDETDNLGVWTVLSSCLMGVTISRASDILQGYLKITLITLMTLSTTMFIWILLLTTQAIHFHKGQLYAAVMLGTSFSWATPALFYELAAEIAYPVPEGIVGGYIATLANLSTTLFFLIYLLPGIGVMWMNYCLLLYSLGSIVAMILVDEQYNRLNIE